MKIIMQIKTNLSVFMVQMDVDSNAHCYFSAKGNLCSECPEKFSDHVANLNTVRETFTIYAHSRDSRYSLIMLSLKLR